MWWDAGKWNIHSFGCGSPPNTRQPPTPFLAHSDVMMVSVCALTWQIIPDFTVKHVWGHLQLSVPMVLLTFVEMWGKRRAAGLSQAILALQGGKAKNIYSKKHVFSAAWLTSVPFYLIICVKNNDLSFPLCDTGFHSAVALVNSKNNALRLSNATNECQLNCSPTEPRSVTRWNTFFKKSQQGACHCTAITAGAEVTHF